MPTIKRSQAASRGSAGDVLHFNIMGGPIAADLGAGYDRVRVSGDGLAQVRLTFTSAEVGNGSANDAGLLANQDGGLAVRIQAEDADGELSGPVSRFDDEGISFIAGEGFTFDVRDLVSGTARGDEFHVVQLGTAGVDRYKHAASAHNFYINAGADADRIVSGYGDDFLVGGGGNDVLDGNAGKDSFIGGAGDDLIRGGKGADTAIVDVAAAGSDVVNLNAGMDTVLVSTSAAAKAVRLTFTSAEVGNDDASDSATMANQDGGLAVRMQAEDGADGLIGPISRYDDEGITFFSSGGVKFDVRDLVSGTQRGDTFDIVVLGASGDDRFDGTPQNIAIYANGGQGDDRMTGGSAADFLVGGVGDDVLNGWSGDDQMIGGAGADRFVFVGNAGNDTILDFESGTDRIDLRSYDIRFRDVTIEQIAGDTRVSGNDNGDTFSITLTGVEDVTRSDFVF